MTAAVLCAPHDIETNNYPNQMEPVSHPQFCKGTILVMDDAAVMQQLLINMLGCLGYASVGTFEGTEALRLYKRTRDDGNPFTGVILDLHNRLGKGGIETIVDLQALDPEVNAVICSADTDSPAMNQFQTHGFRGTLVKPFGLDDLDNVLQCMLGN